MAALAADLRTQIIIFGALAAAGLAVFYVLTGYPYFWYCVFAKRLHDRGKSDWPALAIIFLSWTALVMAATKAVMDAQITLLDSNKLSLIANVIGKLCMAVDFALLAWLLIELGLCRGTAGSNRYGVDPLQLNDKSGS